jgi:hypothetical protein
MNRLADRSGFTNRLDSSSGWIRQAVGFTNRKINSPDPNSLN